MGLMFKQWLDRKFSNPEAVVLLAILGFGSLILYSFGQLLAPILVAIVIAYLLEWGVRMLTLRNIPRTLSVVLVFVAFIGVVFLIVFGLIPPVWQQIKNLGLQIPDMANTGQQLLNGLPDRFPGYISEKNIVDMTNELATQFGHLGKYILSISLSSLMNIVAILIYMILVPLMVFFFLKDKTLLLTWFISHLPKDREMSSRVWTEVNHQIGNYIRGKIVEIIVVGVATYLVFVFMGMNYSLLLGVLVGLSVLIPYVGAAVVTIPVVIIAFMQWGFSADFGYLITFYLIVQGLDGNILVPLLFSEAVCLHPVAIIGAVLVFGGLWGFWGIFFAIPLATLVKAVINAWEDSDESGQLAIENKDG